MLNSVLKCKEENKLSKHLEFLIKRSKDIGKVASVSHMRNLQKFTVKFFKIKIDEF